MTVQAALLQGTKLLEDGGIAAPRLTAEVLLAYALGRERIYLYSYPEQELTDLEWLHFGRYLHERLQGRPTQYITGRQEFYGRRFRVNEDVLIPRPDTELIVETALKFLRMEDRLVDVGCGSGALAVTLHLDTGASAFATDISLPALAVAAGNAQELGAEVQFLACDLLTAVGDASVDMVVSNPPYVPGTDLPGLQREVRDYEPHVALSAGPTGIEIYQRLFTDAARVLRPGGRLIVELGFGTRDRVTALLDSCWGEIEVRPDLAGIPRVLAARLQRSRPDHQRTWLQ